MVQGNVGPYSVVYIKDKTSTIYAKMFDRIEQALDFGHSLTGKWLALQKVGHDGDDYGWKVLPYGSSDSYNYLAGLNKMKPILIIIGLVLAFFLLKKMFAVKPKLPY